MHPRRHHRSVKRRIDLLLARPRHRPQRGSSHADARLCGRDYRPDQVRAGSARVGRTGLGTPGAEQTDLRIELMVRMFDDLTDLYQQVILDHSKSPRNFRKLEGANRTAQGHNPLCGDNYTIYAIMDGDVIKEI